MFKDWRENTDGTVSLIYADNTGIVVSRNDFNRAFGAMINTTKHDVFRDFGIREIKDVRL